MFAWGVTQLPRPADSIGCAAGNGSVDDTAHAQGQGLDKGAEGLRDAAVVTDTGLFEPARKAGNTRSARVWSNATVECTNFSWVS